MTGGISEWDRSVSLVFRGEGGARLHKVFETSSLEPEPCDRLPQIVHFDDPSGPDVSAPPVLRAEGLDSDLAPFTRCVNETVVVQREAHMRRSWCDRREEDEVTTSDVRGGGDTAARVVLILSAARKQNTMLSEDVTREAATVEPGRCRTAGPIRCSPEK